MLVILWAVVRDITTVLGRRHIFQHINRMGGSLGQLNLSTFDTGLHTDMFYHFSSGADEAMVRLYLDVRGCVGSSRQLLRSVDFWRGLKVAITT